MPKFLDYYAKAPQMPAEAVQGVIAAINAKQVDEFGVRPINAFMTGTGEAYCFTEAPDADAVCKSHESHESHGIPLDRGEVKEVQTFV